MFFRTLSIKLSIDIVTRRKQDFLSHILLLNFVCVKLSLFYIFYLTVSVCHFSVFNFVSVSRFLCYTFLVFRCLCDTCKSPLYLFVSFFCGIVNPVLKHYLWTLQDYKHILYKLIYSSSKLYSLVVQMFLSTDLENCWDCIIISEFFYIFYKIA